MLIRKKTLTTKPRMSKLQIWPISFSSHGNTRRRLFFFFKLHPQPQPPSPMGEFRSPSDGSSSPDSSSSSSSSSSTPPAPPPPLPPSRSHTLLQPSSHRKRHHHHKTKVLRAFRSVFRSLPVVTPSCKFHSADANHHHRLSHGGAKITGTLFGYRKGRVSLSLQEGSKCVPSAVVELAIQTSALQKEMSAGMVRIALECEKRAEREKVRLLDEPLWTMFCNGKKTGYGVRREPTEEDLSVMELLKAVSMGAGVLPLGLSDAEGPDGEMAYFRAQFEHIVGSKDSETLSSRVGGELTRVGVVTGKY
ncbi:protein MIZU-KUSSEI 1 [Senna tora]|uniref:Protein MIZU-KUSSEI 1 n=1 Tax=Senna tora TaxID=362788 RepID=A0A834WYB7_9FABA|nr:protein MIZU-KUSSEI 1 [Senna tora]